MTDRIRTGADTLARCSAKPLDTTVTWSLPGESNSDCLPTKQACSPLSLSRHEAGVGACRRPVLKPSLRRTRDLGYSPSLRRTGFPSGNLRRPPAELAAQDSNLDTRIQSAVGCLITPAAIASPSPVPTWANCPYKLPDAGPKGIVRSEGFEPSPSASLALRLCRWATSTCEPLARLERAASDLRRSALCQVSYRGMAGEPGFEPGRAWPSPGSEPGVLPVTPFPIDPPFQPARQAVRMRWQLAHTMSHFSISASKRCQDHRFRALLMFATLSAPSRWSKSMTKDGNRRPQSVHGTSFKARKRSAFSVARSRLRSR